MMWYSVPRLDRKLQRKGRQSRIKCGKIIKHHKCGIAAIASTQLGSRLTSLAITQPPGCDACSPVLLVHSDARCTSTDCICNRLMHIVSDVCSAVFFYPLQNSSDLYINVT